MLSGIMAALPIIKMILELLIKTPEEKLADISLALSRVISEMRDGVKHLEENEGDTSKLEDAINRNRRSAK
jgi:signal transduction histidine kinase